MLQAILCIPGLEEEREERRGKEVIVQMRWAWASPGTPNPKPGLPQKTAFVELGTIPVFGTLTHSKAAPERLCNQTDLVQSYLVVSLSSTPLPSSSGFGTRGLRYELVLQTLRLIFFLSRIYYLRFSGIKPVQLLDLGWHCNSQDWTVLELCLFALMDLGRLWVINLFL